MTVWNSPPPKSYDLRNHLTFKYVNMSEAGFHISDKAPIFSSYSFQILAHKYR